MSGGSVVVGRSPRGRALRPFARMAVMVVAVCVSLFSVASASAAAAAPGWMLTSRAYPTSLPPGGRGQIEIDLYNVGGASSSGAITVVDKLPPGVTAIEAGALWNGIGTQVNEEEREKEKLRKKNSSKDTGIPSSGGTARGRRW